MPAESHSVSTATDIASQVRARRVDPVAITSAALARIAGDSRALAAFRRVRRDEALAEAAALADRSDLGELALAGVPMAVKESLPSPANVRQGNHLPPPSLLLSTVMSSSGYAPLALCSLGRPVLRRIVNFP
jgi:hypothetical protein